MEILETYKDHKISDLVRTTTPRFRHHWIVSNIRTVGDKFVLIRGKQISLKNLKNGYPPIRNAKEKLLFAYDISTDAKLNISNGITIKS